jgi:hypothetical protein
LPNRHTLRDVVPVLWFGTFPGIGRTRDPMGTETKRARKNHIMSKKSNPVTILYNWQHFRPLSARHCKISAKCNTAQDAKDQAPGAARREMLKAEHLMQYSMTRWKISA